jgi:hypothetical protein
LKMREPKKIKSKFFAVLIVCFGCSSVHGFWLPRSIENLVWDADVIVVAEFEGSEPASVADAISNQKAHFRVVQTFKGQIEGAFVVSGSNSGICLPIVDFSHVKKGQYLMFMVCLGETWIVLDATMIAVDRGRLLWREPADKKARLRRVGDVERSIQLIQKRKPNSSPPIPSEGWRG